MDFKVGDWVKSYSQGIWKVERIIKDYYEVRDSLNEPKRKSNQTIIFLKRLVNDKWKRSFSVESCNAIFIRQLTNEEQLLLNNFIYDNPKTMKEFEKYHRNIDFILNISFSISNKKNDSFYAIANNLFENKIKSGLTSEEILNIIDESDIKKYMHKTPINKTLQFASINHEIREEEFIFSEFSILDF